MASFEDRIVDLLPLLRRYARSLARERAEAEDLLQDSVEVALSRATTWRGDNLRGWVMAIMTNLYRNHHRRRAAFARLMADREVLQPVATGDDGEKGRLIAALNALPPEQRAVLMLVVLEGYRYVEVAEMLEIPLGTVMSRLSRARKSLAENWRGDNVVGFRRMP